MDIVENTYESSDTTIYNDEVNFIKDDFGNKGYIDGCDKNGYDAHSHKYNENLIVQIRTVYVIATLVWLFIVFFMGFLKDDPIIIFILLIPVAVFAINFVSTGEFTCHIENQMFKGNFLYFGFIVAVILINWNKDLSAEEKHDIFRILVLALILLMFSMIDVWVSAEEQPIVKHIRTTLHTASLTLLAYGLYEFYIFQGKGMTQ